MITLSKTYTYTDTNDNFTFWAMKKGYQLKVNKLDENGKYVFPFEQIDNPQTVEEFAGEYINGLIKKELTDPIAKEVSRVLSTQNEQIIKVKEAEVLAKLTIK